MALSIAQFAQPSNWYLATGTNRGVTGVAWSSGDVIVAIGGCEAASYTFGTPANANLTFSLGNSVTAGTTNECNCYVWTATAGSSQTGQAITVTISDSAKMGGIAVWVVTGSPTGVGDLVANQTEVGPGIVCVSGSVVCYAHFDWNATNPQGKTPATGSGTATERVDQGNTDNYGIYAADWVGTAAGTHTVGPNNYTSLKVAQGSAEVLPPAAGGGVPPRRAIYSHLIGR